MIDFSKYKFLSEGQHNPNGARGAQQSLEVSNAGTQSADMGKEFSMQKKQEANMRLMRQSSQKVTKQQMGHTMESFKELRNEKELIKSFESQKSDWRAELQEKVIDGQEREQHPFVTVMPTGDENMLQALKQMGKAVKGKKDAVSEEVLLEADEDAEIKKKASVLRQKVKKSRASGQKAMVSKEKRNKYVDKGEMDKAQKEHERGKQYEVQARKDRAEVADDMPVASTHFNTKKNPLRQTKKFDKAIESQKGSEDVVRSASSEKAFVKRKNYGEGFEPEQQLLDEAKKKCKEGYKYDKDKKKCVKKKKKSSSSKKSSKTVYVVGRPIYGGGHHHHHHGDDNDNGGGDNGGGGDSGSGDGGVSEMFDYLGELLMQENSEQDRQTGKQQESEAYRAKNKRMEAMKKEYEEAGKQPSKYDKMTPSQLAAMEKSMGYGSGKNTGD